MEDLERRLRIVEKDLADLVDVVMLMLDRELQLREHIGLPLEQNNEDVEHIRQTARRIRRERGLE